MQVSFIAQVRVAPEELIVIEELRMETRALNKWDPGSIITWRETLLPVLVADASMMAS